MSNKTINRLLKKTEKKYKEYDAARNELEEEVRSLCDFDARVVYLAGDGLLILNSETASVAPFDCLDDVTEDNMLTAEQHKDECI